MGRKFKTPVFEATVINDKNEKMRFYIGGDFTSSEAMQELRKLYPVAAGFSQRTISKLI